jgi:hypothetical protein
MIVSTDTLEYARVALASLLVVSNFVVWGGVYLENNKFTQATKDAGWKMLVCGLAIEAVLAFLLVITDTVISIRQKAEIVALEQAIAPRRLNSDELAKFAAATKSFAGRSVSVWSYSRDIESEILAGQIIEGLELAQIPVINAVGAMISSTSARIGVHLTGPDDELIAALMVGLKALSPVRDPYKPTAGVSVPPAEIFVGVKPIAGIKQATPKQ